MAPDLNQLLRRVLGTAEEEIGCDECFEQLDGYVDLKVVRGDPEEAFPGFRAHLAGCPACRDEYESLRALVMAA